MTSKTNRLPRRYAIRKRNIPGASSENPVGVMYKFCTICYGEYEPEIHGKKWTTTWIKAQNKKGQIGWQCLCCLTWNECDKGNNGQAAKDMGCKTAEEATQKLHAALIAVGLGEYVP